MPYGFDNETQIITQDHEKTEYVCDAKYIKKVGIEYKYYKGVLSKQADKLSEKPTIKPINYCITQQQFQSSDNSSKKQITINFVPYNTDDTKTSIDNMDYYKLYHGCVFVLTNGANQYMNYINGDSGTTLAIQTLNLGLFDNITVDDCIFQPNIEQYPSFINSGDQQIIFSSTDTKLNKPAGTVYYKESNSNADSEFKDVVKGVFHIKGVNLNVFGIEAKTKEKEIENLVYEYYTAVLNKFKELCGESDINAIHLAPIPGQIFNGSEITENALLRAVNDFIGRYDLSLPSITINIGIDVSNKYHNIRFYTNIIKYIRCELDFKILTKSDTYNKLSYYSVILGLSYLGFHQHIDNWADEKKLVQIEEKFANKHNGQVRHNDLLNVIKHDSNSIIIVDINNNKHIYVNKDGKILCIVLFDIPNDGMFLGSITINITNIGVTDATILKYVIIKTLQSLTGGYNEYIENKTKYMNLLF